ncbi:uncharacterized protein LOC115622611 [Scaptodrosophila lebanonensis]|uniref:Uncharacterized protein LOC115622611 n=1 Tax=Drosophila lebanonensis TaxID=7225 RepID=A0A6J2TBY5_DROLE|nr:uncharacterized protein LOC115622611 [Scaptodrosophila lebanonensis]
MAGVSVGFAKCFILFMAVVILLQGVIYLGLSIWGITQRNCNLATNLMDDPFKFATDLIYFADESCGDPTVTYGEYVISLPMDWPKSFAITNREFIFMITYAAVSGLWVVTSFLVLATLCSTTTKVISGAIYWPWFLVILAGSILDVVATVYHAIDISNTTSLDSALNYIGATKPDEPYASTIWSSLEPYGVYFTTPAIVLTCLSSRVVLIWLLNLFGASFCLSLSRILASQAKPKSVAPSQAPTRQQTPQPEALVVRQVSVAETSPQQQSSTQPPNYVEQYPEQIRPKPLPIIIPAQNVDQLQQQDSRVYRPSDRTTLQSPVAILPPQVPQQQGSAPPMTPEIQPHPENNTYRTTDAHPDSLNYPPVEPVSPQRANSPAAQQLAATSTLNSRYADAYSLPQQQPNPRVSAELRNQMPWSYTSMITKPPPPPRKPQQQVQIYPQIPEPDYVDY